MNPPNLETEHPVVPSPSFPPSTASSPQGRRFGHIKPGEIVLPPEPVPSPPPPPSPAFPRPNPADEPLHFVFNLIQEHESFLHLVGLEVTHHFRDLVHPLWDLQAGQEPPIPTAALPAPSPSFQPSPRGLSSRSRREAWTARFKKGADLSETGDGHEPRFFLVFLLLLFLLLLLLLLLLVLLLFLLLLLLPVPSP